MRFFEPIQLTEPLDGPDGAFLRSIIDDRPDLLVMEIAPLDAPPHHLIHLLKTSAATRRIPILAVGASSAELEAARQTGADLAILEDEWPTRAADLMASWIVGVDRAGRGVACAGSLHPLAAKGVAAINGGQYYPAHEFLEEAWMSADDSEGALYRALLQVAVTYLQLERQNLRGALKMLLRMRQWLDPLPEICRGIDINQLRDMMASLQHALESLDIHQPQKIREDWFQPIPLQSASPDVPDEQPS